MSERIRSLEYAYRTSGEASDLLAWIHARQRAGLFLELAPREGQDAEEGELRLARWVEALAGGQLQPEQIELAAYLGDPLARLLDEERAISLATYLGEGLELVPLVLGEEASSESIARWIAALRHWCPSWVAEAQWAIAAYHLEQYQAPEVADDDPYAFELRVHGDELEDTWRADLAAVRTYLDRNAPYPDVFAQSFGDMADLVQAAAHVALKCEELSWVSIELGPEPDLVPDCVREALLPKVLRVA